MSEKCQKLEGGYGPLSRNPPRVWSGRPDSNRRRPAWEAGILPLNYGRPTVGILHLAAVLERHVVGLDQFVAARFPVELAAGAVEIDLLVERHRRLILDPELVDPVDLLE